METDNRWRDKTITKRQARVLCNFASESFGQLTRGEASDLIQHWLRSKEKTSYDDDILEENK